MMLSFKLLLIFLSGIRLASGTFIDFQLTTSDPNHLTLQCFSALTEDIDPFATISLFNSADGNSSATRSIFSGGTLDVTPMNEGFLRCTSGDGMEQSKLVAIAGETIGIVHQDSPNA